MNQTIVPNAGPKLRLVEAAEKLFAEKGFEAVSVRDITKEAGANVAAVNYHFGSRDGLVLAVIGRYLMPVNKERLARLERAEENGGNVQEILEAFMLPVVEQISKSELTEKLYCQLLGRVFTEQNVSLPSELEQQTKTIVDRFSKALSKQLPGYSIEETLWRLHFIVGGLIHTLTHTAFLLRIAGNTLGSPTIEEIIPKFVKFAMDSLIDGMAAPQKEKVKEVSASVAEVISASEEISAEPSVDAAEIVNEVDEEEEAGAVVEKPKTPQGTFNF